MTGSFRRRFTGLFMATALIGTSAALPFLAPQKANAETVAAAQKVDTESQTALDTFRTDVKGANQVLANAKGILVFPHIYQGGFVVGAEYGKGSLFINNAVVAHYNIAQGSFGFQIGAQRKGLILAFMTDDALNKFRNSTGFELGADAGVTVVKLGAEGAIDSTTLQKPILAFVVGQKGLMGDISVQGTKITRLRD